MFGSGAVAGDGFMIKGGRPRLPFFVRVAVEGEWGVLCDGVVG